MILFKILSWVCVVWFAFNTLFLLWVMDHYQRAEHATRNNFFALVIQLTGMLANWYSAIHYNPDWYIKEFSISVMVGSTVSFYNTYRFGMRKEPGEELIDGKPLWMYIAAIVIALFVYCIFTA